MTNRSGGLPRQLSRQSRDRFRAVCPVGRVHAPNTVGNFCFDVTLGYRRLEPGR